MKKVLSKAAKQAANQAVQLYVPPQYQASVRSVANVAEKVVTKQNRKRNRKNQSQNGFSRDVQQMTSIPAQIGVAASHMSKTHSASYNFTLITSLTAKSASVRVYLSPKMDVVVNGATVQVDPKIFLDAQRHREYRITRVQATYPAGITSTATGTIFLAGSQDANVAQPESSTYSYIQKNAKSSVTTPTTFTSPVDNNWKTIEFYANSAGLSTADKKTLLAGVFDTQFMIDTTTFAGIRLDFTMSIEYRGLNPEFSALALSTYPLPVADAASNYSSRLVNYLSTSPVSPIFETASTYKLAIEPGFNLIDFTHSGDGSTYLVVRDKDGVDVSSARIRYIRTMNYQGGQTGSLYRIYTGNGTALTLREDYTATDLFMVQEHLLVYGLTGDVIDLPKGTTKATGRIVMDISTKQIPREQAGALISLWDPTFDPTTLPIV